MIPSLTDIIAAATDSRFIKDPFFRGEAVAILDNGRPEMYGGGFSQVFVINKNQEKWAFKVWSHEIQNNAQRYSEITKYLQQINLPYFLEFEYVQGGLLVDGELLDIMRMEWINGQSLVHYISHHLHDREILLLLAKNFLKMTHDFHDVSISHGDLHHENIYVCDGGKIKLIDYDSLCVPALEGSRDICRGRPGYQHPSRLSSGYLSSVKMDYFSELIIYISILAVAENPILWDKYDVAHADYRLLFTYSDFLDFEASELRKDLNFLSEEIVKLVSILDSYLASHLKLSPFETEL